MDFTTSENQRMIALERSVDLALRGTISPNDIETYAQRFHNFLSDANAGAKQATTVVNNHVGAQVHVD